MPGSDFLLGEFSQVFIVNARHERRELFLKKSPEGQQERFDKVILPVGCFIFPSGHSEANCVLGFSGFGALGASPFLANSVLSAA